MSTRSVRVSSLAILAFAGGCADPGGEGDAANVATSQQALNGACLAGDQSSGWLTQPVGATSPTFRVDLDATTGGSTDDTLFGLSDGAADQYADLAAIVRFSPNGRLEARNGGSYGAEGAVPYRAGESQHFKLWVDTNAHRYTVYANAGTGDRTVAQDYAFRTEQAEVIGLNSLGMKVDSGGPLEVCNVIVTQPGCYTAGSNEGFFNHAFVAQGIAVTVTFTVIPSANGIDGVVGLSNAPASQFNDVAAAIRFNESGTIDARNGSSYAAEEVVAYQAGQSYPITLVVDVLGHAYSAFVDSHLIAHNYAFRSQQAAVASLGNVAFISDSAAGSFRLCDIFVAPPRGVASLHHATAATLPDGGVSDAAGNRYRTGTFSGTYDAGGGPLVSAGGTDVYVAKYAATGAHVWSRRYGGPGDDFASAPRVNANGELGVRIGSELVRLDASGTERFRRAVASQSPFDIDFGGNTVTGEDPSFTPSHTLAKVGLAGEPVWNKQFPVTDGGASLHFVSVDSAGNVLIAGSINGTIDVGIPITARSSEGDSQTFIAKFDPNGALLYGLASTLNLTIGLTVDGFGNATIGGYDYNPDIFRLVTFDSNGLVRRDIGGHELVSPLELGGGGAPVADADGYVTWPISPRRSGNSIALVVKLLPLP